MRPARHACYSTFEPCLQLSLSAGTFCIVLTLHLHKHSFTTTLPSELQPLGLRACRSRRSAPARPVLQSMRHISVFCASFGPCSSSSPATSHFQFSSMGMQSINLPFVRPLRSSGQPASGSPIPCSPTVASLLSLFYFYPCWYVSPYIYVWLLLTLPIYVCMLLMLPTGMLWCQSACCGCFGLGGVARRSYTHSL